MIYKLVHTGAKSQFGGLNEGLFSVGYHVRTDCAVAQPPTAPIHNVMATFMMKAKNFIF